MHENKKIKSRFIMKTVTNACREGKNKTSICFQ